MDWDMLVGWAAGFIMGMASTLLFGAGMAAGQADEADSRRAERQRAAAARERTAEEWRALVEEEEAAVRRERAEKKRKGES